MKLMSKLLKKNNKGLSLVELICAIAILGLSTTAIGGAMVMSARHYQKDSAEFSIQQEAQLVTNQVGNLVVDAADAKWDPTNKKLTIQSDDKKHIIYQSGDKLLYELYNNSNAKISEGVLAEGVAANGFAVDDSAFTSNKNVNVSLTLAKDGRNIKADYNATSRNGKLADYEMAQQVAVISMEDVIVIEPQMTNANSKPYKAEIKVNGMTWEEVGGVVIDTTTTNVPNGFHVKIEAEDGKHYLYVEAEQNAGGSFPVYLKTFNTKDGTVPLAEKQIIVKVRRINDLIINNPSGTNITLGNANTEFVLYATAMGDNITEGFGFKYDDAPYDYVNPRYVEFDIECPVQYEFVKTEDSDSPNVKIKITENMVDGQQIKVTAYSKHAYKGKNKSGKAYDTSDNVVEQYIIECDRPVVPTPDPSTPVPTFGPEGVLRGKDYNWGCTVSNVSQFASTFKKNNETITFNWYVRFSEKGQNNWTPYHLTEESGDNRKVSGTSETLYMLPDKAYDIQFFILYTDGNKIVFPHDNSLLDAGNGFAEAGFVKGWSDDEATATVFEQYGGQTSLDAINLYYYNNMYQTSDDFSNIGVDEELDFVGDDSKEGAIKISINGIKSGNSERKVFFDIRHLYKTSYGIEPVFWKKVDNNWVKLEHKIGNDGKKTNKMMINEKQCFRYEFDKNGGNIGFWDVYDQNEADDVTSNKKGIYRMGFILNGTYTTYNEDKATNRSMSGHDDKSWKLYDESGSDGFYYFQITD